MISWRIHHAKETASTNIDARGGAHGEVFVADFQTAGRGRLDHRWLSPPGTNLMMSAVLSVEGLATEQAVTLPLVVGLSVCEALASFLLPSRRPLLKWPNDVLVEERKLAGILCERMDDHVIVGIGVNVAQTEFPPELSERATSLACEGPSVPSCTVVRDAVLARLSNNYEVWRLGGFASVYPQIAAIDTLKGRWLLVRQTDDDTNPVRGISGGIRADGSLDVGGVGVYAGEAHVLCMGA